MVLCKARCRIVGQSAKHLRMLWEVCAASWQSTSENFLCGSQQSFKAHCGRAISSVMLDLMSGKV